MGDGAERPVLSGHRFAVAPLDRFFRSNALEYMVNLANADSNRAPFA